MDRSDAAAAVGRNLMWFKRSGVMLPVDGSWGVAERLVQKAGNEALEQITNTFTAYSDRGDFLVVEQRRADCNFEAAWLFLLASRIFPVSDAYTIGSNILQYLYCRSGLLERSAGEKTVYGSWNWSHTMRQPALWFDDNAWCIFLQLKIGELFPEFEARYNMRSWALILAEEILRGAKENPGNMWSGNLALPHWGSLVCMALAEAYRYDPKVEYAEYCSDYYRNIAPPNGSEHAYALLGALNCRRVFGGELFAQAVKNHSEALLNAADPVTGNIPSEHYEAPGGEGVADLIYTMNWARLSLREAGLAGDERCAALAEKIGVFLFNIQDTSADANCRGCWRGMYDMTGKCYGGGNRHEGGAGSIYTGWTNAPLAVTFALEADRNRSIFAGK